MRPITLEELQKPANPLDPHIFQSSGDYAYKNCKVCKLDSDAAAHEYGEKLYGKAARRALEELRKSYEIKIPRNGDRSVTPLGIYIGTIIGSSLTAIITAICLSIEGY